MIHISCSQRQAAKSIQNVWIVIKGTPWGNNKTRHKRSAKDRINLSGLITFEYGKETIDHE